MTALEDTAVPELSPAQRGSIVSSSTMPLRRFAGLILVALAIAVVEITGRPAGLDPAVLIAMAVLAGAAVDGLLGGSIGAVVGGMYMALYYADPVAAGSAATARTLVGIAATALALLVPSALRERARFDRRRAARQVARTDSLISFANRLGSEQPEAMARSIVRGAVEFLDADLAVLTELDPASGRHIVRAAHGGASSSVGIEVLPGTGVTGQAIAERRMVIAGAPLDPNNAARLQSRLRGGSGVAQTIAAVPCLQAGRVIATLTVGRSDGTPFSAEERRLLEATAPLVTLAVTSSLARHEADEGSPRDTLTGLYNKAYLEAALEQMIALRRRAPDGQRPPLSIIMFDIDTFSMLNDRYGRHVGDHVLRAVATLMRRRFRASDIVARSRADSFLAVLNGASAEIATEAAAQIKRQVRELTLTSPAGDPLSISLSAGCATYHDGEPPEALLRSVETALETARWSGPGALAAV